jgi:hypothetical protein
LQRVITRGLHDPTLRLERLLLRDRQGGLRRVALGSHGCTDNAGFI